MHLVSLKPIASSVNASHLPMLVKDEWEKWGNFARISCPAFLLCCPGIKSNNGRTGVEGSETEEGNSCRQALVLGLAREHMIHCIQQIIQGTGV
jgi:hypothetical protein